MEIRLHRELAEFAALTNVLYAADPVTHTVTLTVLARASVRWDRPTWARC